MTDRYANLRRPAWLMLPGLVLNQIRAMIGVKGGMHHLADHQRCAETAKAFSDGGAAFGWREAFAAALQGHGQKAAVLEFAKHSRGLLAAYLSQVSQESVNTPKIVNTFLWRNNGDVAHA